MHPVTWPQYFFLGGLVLFLLFFVFREIRAHILLSRNPKAFRDTEDVSDGDPDFGTTALGFNSPQFRHHLDALDVSSTGYLLDNSLTGDD